MFARLHVGNIQNSVKRAHQGKYLLEDTIEETIAHVSITKETQRGFKIF